jgi:hypothetical protein
MTSKRTVALSGALALAAILAAGAWVAGSRIESPADAAARTAPPDPSPILVPVEERVLSANVVTRGKGRYGLPQPLSIAPSVLKGAPGLIATLPLRNAQFSEGDVLLTASGRPVFALQGNLPAYRDLVPGISGEDVRQLESALERLGFPPGSVDGNYDQRTSAAVARWYNSKGWDPFGPTRDQLANFAALERNWGEANKNKLAAAAAAAAASLTVESARATAEQNNRTAEAELAAMQANTLKFGVIAGQDISQAVEAARAKAEFANRAAEAELTRQIAERALVVMDPRQPESARAAADAKLELARAAASNTKLEGELAVQAAQHEASLASQRVARAEAALNAARLDGEKMIQAALDAKQIAQLEARLATERANRAAADLDFARRKLGVQVPVDEIVFIRTLPVRVQEVSAAVGAPAAGTVMSVTDNQLAVDTALALDVAPLVKQGMRVMIDEQALGITAAGVVQTVAGTPGTRGVDGYHIYCEIRVVETSAPLEGVSLRLTIPIESTQGAVTAVPISALSLAADGTSRVQVQGNAGLEYIDVKPGLSADGYVEVTPVRGRLAPGQLVVVGYKNPGTTVSDGKAPQ